jgi:hypothetical protein
MKYTSINIQGNLISEEILHKVEEADAQGQLVKDFGFEPGINLRNEIEYAWSRIKLDWKHFFDRTEKLPPSDPYGTTLSRKWMVSFFSTLGYDLTLQKASLQGDNEQLYSISHTCDQLDGLPVHIVGFYDPSHPNKNTLDIRSSGGTSRLSPHSTIQEYLNVSGHLYAMATNGLILRLVRDSGRLVKMTYIEFDLKRLLEDDKYSEFTLLYRLLHASRFPKSKQDAEQCFLEKYYLDSIESGNRIREGLSDAVKESLVALGNGLLEHPENEELREKITSGRPDAREYYHQLLRLIYRLLFLMVTEERDLVFSDLLEENKEPDMDDLLKGIKRPSRKQKEIYYNFYSLVRLRKLSQKRYLLESQYSDLWQGLMQAFALFESGGTGLKLGIQALGSELFSHNAMPDITSSKVNNMVLLKCIKSLNEFEDEKHNLSFINYRALDVEELGSVYEGLLELEPVFVWENGRPRFTFKKGSERSSSGSHYTPEDLVKPLIQHSLEYLIEDRVIDFYKGKANKTDTIKKLLDLKICDVACGSGHILLSAARRIALEMARVETGEQQPNPSSFRHALKEVIKNCIYGVDKNPLAVELCKVALWLESHNPGEPLSFLDHRIKCGDAIVGLSHREELQKGIPDEAYQMLPGDDKEISSTFLKKNRQERVLREKSGQAVQLTTEADQKLMEQVKELNRLIENFSTLPENTPEEIEKKEKAYRILINSENLKRLKILADLKIMPFFLPKSEINKDILLTDALYHRYLRGETKVPTEAEGKAIEIAVLNRFFHWFLEFPEVIQNGGFDCILGNPPFLGDRRLKEAFGENYLEWIRYNFSEGATVDLVVYFFLRVNSLIKRNGFQSLISTNTVAQGKAREFGLEKIIENGSTINHAVKGMKWPGLAAVEVSIVSIIKGNWKSGYTLNGKTVNNISAFLDESENTGTPFQLHKNLGKSYQGSIILGMGFVLNQDEYESMIRKEKRNEKVLFPYLNGDDLNSNPDQKPSRYVINFFDWNEDQASKYEIPYSVLIEKVKPERQRWKTDKSENPIEGVYALRKPLPEKWWQHAERRPALYAKVKEFKKVLVSCRVSKYVNQSFVEVGPIFDVATTVVTRSEYWEYALLQNSMHEVWAWKYASTLESRIRYVNVDCIDTFSFPERLPSNITQGLDCIGQAYYEHRKQFMLTVKVGLTKTYNAFHAKDISVSIITSDVLNSNKKTIEKQFGKEVWNLWNHLQKTEDSCSFEEAVAGILKLRELHVEMDNTVLAAYGWKDIDLKHDFYEMDYLPENDRVRFTIHPDARKEVLKRLLELNHKIYEEEVKAGLWDKKTGTKKSEKEKTTGDQVSEPEEGYGGLFDLT